MCVNQITELCVTAIKNKWKFTVSGCFYGEYETFFFVALIK